MASKTDIAVRALSKLGQPRISNIDTTDTKPARVLRGMWDSVRDAMLQAYPWKFAGKRTHISADGSAPDWGYDRQFTLPNDYLSLRAIKDNPEYEIEGGRILTDASAPLYIKYTRRVENTGEYHPLFVEAFAARLAYEACEEITQSNVKKDACLRDLDLAINQAYAIEAIENEAEELPEDEWLTARA